MRRSPHDPHGVSSMFGSLEPEISLPGGPVIVLVGSLSECCRCRYHHQAIKLAADERCRLSLSSIFRSRDRELVMTTTSKRNVRVARVSRGGGGGQEPAEFVC